MTRSRPLHSTSNIRVVAVLRRATDLDAKDAAIVRAVAQAWGDSKVTPSYMELCGVTGFPSTNTIHYRIVRRETSLVREGWLTKDKSIGGRGRSRVRTLRPGPKFKGLDQDGWPLESIWMAD